MLRLCTPSSRAALFRSLRIQPSILAFHSTAPTNARKSDHTPPNEDIPNPARRRVSRSPKKDEPASSTIKKEPKKTKRTLTSAREKGPVSSAEKAARKPGGKPSELSTGGASAASAEGSSKGVMKGTTSTRKTATGTKRTSTSIGKNQSRVTAGKGTKGVSKKAQSSRAKKIVDPPLPELMLEYLQYAYTGDRTSWWKCDNRRINVVSETLCEDILERMKPSLLKHKGCDIIELNPGVGIWSSKLHDLLQPRTHILMEPDYECYKPYLSKLEFAKESTYKMIPRTGIVWGHLNTAASKEYLPHQEELPRGDPRLEQPNDTLLFVANLGYYPSKPYKGFASVSTLMIYQLLSAARTHALFQKYGLVRMLIWLSDSEKNIVLPRTISYRRKYTVEGELTCEHIIEVAGAESPDVQMREHSLDIESSLAVQKKMATANITTPPGRMSKLQMEVSQKVDSEEVDDVTYRRPYYMELETLEKDFANGVFAQYVDEKDLPPRPAKGKGSRSMQVTPEYYRLTRLRQRAVWDKRRDSKMELLLQDYESITATQETLLANGPDEGTGINQESLDQRMEEVMTELESWNNIEQAQFWLNVDNRRALRRDPPMLLWDRRPTEPLAVRPKDFFPRQEMCLLDFQPRSMWPVLRDNNLHNYDYIENILSALLMTPTQSVKRGLNALAPGALEWLVTECPSLTDPAKGGNRNLEHLTVRSLTQEMLEEIMEAWMRWPFRPSRHEMIVRTGTVPFDPSEEDSHGPMI
ncbi:hypothetical protein B7463_g2058, partial [Scytalidium lignicola]